MKPTLTIRRDCVRFWQIRLMIRYSVSDPRLNLDNLKLDWERSFAKKGKTKLESLAIHSDANAGTEYA